MDDWCARAADLGVDDAKLIHPKTVIVADWVRLKCQFGCDEYGQRLTCPPYSPAPETTRQLLSHYEQALLLRLDRPGGGMEEKKRLRMEEVVADLEREIFLAGHERAFGMSAGPCTLCETCDISAPCLLPSKARPSVEACGIDVYTTVRKAGWNIEVAQTCESSYSVFGLILIE